MKAIIWSVSLCLSVVFYTEAEAQWRWQVTLPADSTHGYRFGGVSFYGTTGTVCGMIEGRYKDSIPLFCKHTTDGGRTWTNQYLCPAPNNWYTHRQTQGAFQLNERICFIIGDSGLILKTSDGGLNWIRQTCHEPTFLPFDIHFSDSVHGILVGNRPSVVFTTSDGGTTWTPVCHAIEGLWDCYSFGSGRYSVFSFWNRKMYFTSDEWKTIDSGEMIPRKYKDYNSTFNVQMCRFGSDGTVLGSGTLYIADSSNVITENHGGFIRSTDGGRHWLEPVLLDRNSGGPWFSDIEADTIFAGADFSLNYFNFSTDGGRSWHDDTLVAPSDMPGGYIVEAIYPMPDGSVLAYLSTQEGSYGLFARGTRVPAGVNGKSTYIYACVYPNPARDKVSIGPLTPNASIRIVDILGREVLRGQLNGEGNLTVDISQLPRGIYSVLLDHSDQLIPVGKVAVE